MHWVRAGTDASSSCRTQIAPRAPPWIDTYRSSRCVRACDFHCRDGLQSSSRYCGMRVRDGNGMERAQAREGRDGRPGGTMAAVGSMGTGSGSEWDAGAVDVRPGGAPRAIGRVAENSRRRHRAGQMRQGPRRGGGRDVSSSVNRR
ncbi:hypothetical protein K466DRAFT_146511 [Polyporus arcularius HHB13444]|uniref:Uncharacterized protein n=1 Tax=Polyporus arcularius HHB13444 TaxID=1314778 RepID=A0A5C3PYS9_9APHY|nr:hypothetical protein K466DRAFT_146511 [Polyporus arcularius HHB13444]